MKLKRILIGLAIVVVVAVVGVVVALSTMDFDNWRGVIEAEAKKATGRDLVVAGPIGLGISMTPSIEVSDVSFANADWGSRPAMATIERLDLQVSLADLLGGEINVQRLILVGPDILLETDAEGRGNWDFAGGHADRDTDSESGGAPLLPGFVRVEIENGRLAYHDGQTGAIRRLDLASLTAQAKSADSPINLSLEGAFDGTPLALVGSVGPISALKSGPYPVDLKGMAAGATLSIAGTIAEPLAGTGIDLKIAVEGDSLAALAAAAGAEAPKLGAYAFAARTVVADDRIDLSDLDARLGGSHLTGAVSVALGGPRPAVSGALAVDRVDVAALAPPGGTEADAKPGPFVIPDQPLPLDGLGAVDADLELDVGNVALKPGLELTSLKGTVKVAEGRLTLAPFGAGLSGGSLSLDLRLGGGAMKAKGTARSIDFGRLLKTLAVSEEVTGNLDAGFDLRGSGNSPRALASSLNGHAEIGRGQGTIDNDLLGAAAAGLTDILSPMMEDSGNLRLNCLFVRFDIKNGLATSHAIVIDTDAFTVIGGGTIDLKTEKLDLAFDTESKSVSLVSLAVPFNITGTLAQPTASPDAAGLATGAAKVAGTIIMPIPAIIGLIGDSQVGGDSKNACVSALESAKEKPAAEPAKSTVDEAAEGVGDAIEDVGEGISKGIKSLFGD
jgi:uncharacterized protein involved in outer membrane biogenesis